MCCQVWLLVFDGVQRPARNEQRVKTRSVTFENIGGSPIVTPLFSNVSSFDAAERVWYIAACPDDQPGEPLSSMSRNPVRPLWLGRRRKRVFAAGTFAVIYSGLQEGH